MAKPTPNVLEDLLFHTQPDGQRTTEQRCNADVDEPRTTDWTRPDWRGNDADPGIRVAIHPLRLPGLRAYAEAEGLSLRDAVDRALALLWARPGP